jgi:hypothetical protein
MIVDDGKEDWRRANFPFDIDNLLVAYFAFITLDRVNVKQRQMLN